MLLRAHFHLSESDESGEHNTAWVALDYLKELEGEEEKVTDMYCCSSSWTSASSRSSMTLALLSRRMLSSPVVYCHCCIVSCRTSSSRLVSGRLCWISLCQGDKVPAYVAPVVPHACRIMS